MYSCYWKYISSKGSLLSGVERNFSYSDPVKGTFLHKFEC